MDGGLVIAMNREEAQEEKLRARSAAMHEAELVLWLCTLERVTQVERRLELLTGPGPNPPDPFGNLSSAAIQGILRAELSKRTLVKGGETG
jgi:hypothetical protein